MREVDTISFSAFSGGKIDAAVPGTPPENEPLIMLRPVARGGGGGSGSVDSRGGAVTAAFGGAEAVPALFSAPSLPAAFSSPFLASGDRPYTGADVATFRQHYEAVGHAAADAARQAAGATDATGAPSHGPHVTEAGVAARHPMAAVLQRLRAQAAAGADGAGAAGFGATRGTDASHGRPCLQPHYQPESTAALASLAALRFGLQELEVVRRRRNAVLNRDPSGATHHSRLRGLPPGRDAPYPSR
jgi:hypothetical protein